MYGNNVPFPRDLRHTLKLANEHTDKRLGEAQGTCGAGGVYDIDLTPLGYDASSYDVQELELSAEKAQEIYDAIKNSPVRLTALDESFGMWTAYSAFTQATIGDTTAMAGFMNIYGDTKYSLIITTLAVDTEAHTATVMSQLFPLT